MKKFLILFILVALLVLVVGPYVPYWVLMIGVVLLSFVVRATKLISFLSSGISFGLTWMALALFISIKTDSELPKRMAELMGLENDNLLLFGTVLLGFMIGSFCGLTGTMLRRFFEIKD